MVMLRKSSYTVLEKSEDSPLYEYMLKLIQKENRKLYNTGEFKTTNPVLLKDNRL